MSVLWVFDLFAIFGNEVYISWYNKIKIIGGNKINDDRKFLYHGSVSADITELKANSPLHGSDKKVVYLTDNIPYALFYIWDGGHNNYTRKFVTGWIKNKIAYY